MLQGFADSLVNFVANLGTERDKAASSYYTTPTIDDGQLAAMYRGSAIAKKIIDMPAEDACREWREWQASADEITSIEEEEKRLGLVAKVLQARKKARLFGGSAILIGTGDANPEMPLESDRLKIGGIKYLTVIGRDQLSVRDLQRDPREDGYGLPAFYTMQAPGGSILIHPSRLVVFRGEEHLDERFAGSDLGWGDSVLLSCLTNVRDMDATIANVASLVFEAKVDVIGIPNLMANLQNGGDQYEKLLLRRATLAQTGKGINGTLLTDAEENHSQKTASFATLPNVIDRFMQMTSAASGIPQTLLFGTSPGGMNATGDADTRGYYDRVKVNQTLDMQPAMGVLDECLIRSALGDRPKEIHYNWRPLWQPTAKEKADTGKVIADTFKSVLEMDVLPPEAIGNALVNGLTESGLAPGLEGDVEEFNGVTAPNPDDRDDLDRMGDAKPRTLYVHRKVQNASEIIEWARSQGFSSTLSADDLHVTIAFSRTAIDWMSVGSAWEAEIEVSEGGPRLMERFGDARVLLFGSDHLAWRHEEIKRHGARWDHEGYQPHITISYDESSPDLADVEPYQGKIILGPEIFQEVKEDWQEGISEE